MDRTKTIEVDVAGYQVSCRSDRRFVLLRYCQYR